MLVYIFDKNTKEYLYEYAPQKNPKNPKEFIFPSNSTTIKPEKLEGYIPVFQNNNWKQILDFRGNEIINTKTKERKIYNKIGDLPENNILYSEYLSSEEYKIAQEELAKETNRNIILNKITELDLKRIRAICEPEIREDGTSWLEYYTTQIIELRNQLKEMK